MTRTATKRLDDIDAKLSRARAHEAAGRAAKAESLYRQVLGKDARNAGALHALGLIARRRGRPERAVQLMAKAADAAPDDAAVHCDLGNALKALGRIDEAVFHHRRMAALCPDSPQALSNLGTTCVRAGDIEEALQHLARAASLDSANPELHHNLGNGLLATARFDDARAAFQRVIGLAPEHVRAQVNLGVAEKELGDLDAARHRFAVALELAPDDADAGWNRALADLMAGDWAAGWAGYEHRRRIPGFAMRRVDRPAWDGAPLDGRTLLVHAEQGLGDTLQFIRYLPPLAARSPGIVLWAQDALVPLLSGFCDRVDVTADPPPTDLQAPLMSLPHLLGGAGPFVAEPASYLSAAPNRITRWREKLADDAFNIGIAWQGRPGYAADARRSIPLDHFAPLATLSGVRLVSLQKGHGSEQLAAFDGPVLDFGPDLDRDGAFLDSVAVIAALDLVITSDTAIAHLAGALGAPVWLALAHVPDWRWGLGGETTPWYPTMRLFRQDRPGDWAGVFERIARVAATRRPCSA
jgi:Flp pilus assembly protein TadD